MQVPERKHFSKRKNYTDCLLDVNKNELKHYFKYCRIKVYEDIFVSYFKQVEVSQILSKRRPMQ